MINGPRVMGINYCRLASLVVKNFPQCPGYAHSRTVEDNVTGSEPQTPTWEQGSAGVGCGLVADLDRDHFGGSHHHVDNSLALKGSHDRG